MKAFPACTVGVALVGALSCTRVGGALAANPDDAGASLYRRWNAIGSARESDVPATASAEFRKCQRAGKAFSPIPDRRWSSDTRLASLVRAAIDQLTTRDYDRFQEKSPVASMIYLEGASSSKHWHDVLRVGDAEIGGNQLRVVAVWSLAYGKSAHDTERVFSLLEYGRNGSHWDLVTAGIGLSTYVGPRTGPPRLVRLDTARYVVELPADGEAANGEARQPEYFVPDWGCFRTLTESEQAELRQSPDKGGPGGATAPAALPNAPR
jgi:hypothetical protein